MLGKTAAIDHVHVLYKPFVRQQCVPGRILGAMLDTIRVVP